MFHPEGPLGNHSGAGPHVDEILGSCAQSLYALRLFRVHGLRDDALRVIDEATIVARLLHAATAWWGFATAEKVHAKNESMWYLSDDAPTSGRCVAVL